MKASSDLRILSETNVQELIRESARRDLKERVIEQLEQVLTAVRSTFVERVLMPETPTVSLRVDSLHVLIQTIMEVSPERGEQVLEGAGKRVGKDFARSVGRFLETTGLVANSRSVLLQVWTMLDGGAGWGRFHAEENLDVPNISIVLEDSDLVKGLAAPVEATTHFLTGYVFGVAWELLKYYPRRLTQVGYPCPPILEPFKIELVSQSPGGVNFSLSLREEELRSTFDQIYQIRRLLALGDLRSIGVETRKALETGLKEKLGEPESEHYSIPALTKAYKQFGVDRRVRFSFADLDKIYNKISPDAHRPTSVTIEEAQQSLDVVEAAFEDLELLELGTGKRREIVNKARERRVRDQPRQGSEAPEEADSQSTGGVYIRAEQVQMTYGPSSSPTQIGGHATIVEIPAEIIDILEHIQTRLDPRAEEVQPAAKEIGDLLAQRAGPPAAVRERLNRVVSHLQSVSSVASQLIQLQEHLRAWLG